MPQAPLATSDLLPGEWRGNAVSKSLIRRLLAVLVAMPHCELFFRG